MICVFDIETIPDTHLLAQTFGFSGSELEICAQALQKSDFCRVVVRWITRRLMC